MSALPPRAEVAIVGAGFAGVATAWALARRGVGDVVVLEREAELGRFASGRSAGLGRQLAEDDDTTALTVHGAQLLRELGAPAWTPTGGLLTFDDAALADVYTMRAASFAVAVEALDREAVVARWPLLADLRVARGLFVPSDGTIDVRALLATLARTTRVVHTAVTAIVDGPRVVTTLGTLDARVIVDASGAWAGALVGEPPLDALKRHVFVLDAEAVAGAPWLWHVGSGELYVRATAEGVLASPCDGAASVAGHQEPDLVGEAHLRRLLDDAAPDLALAPIARRWACQRAFAADRRMRVGRDPSRSWLVWAAALGGHGATAALAVGERAAEAVVAALT